MTGVSSRTRSKYVLASVSSRTRSKNVQLFSCISLDGSSSSKSKRFRKGLGSVSGSKKRRVEVKEDDLVATDGDVEVGLEDCDDDMFEGGFDVKKEIGSDGFFDKDENFVDEKSIDDESGETDEEEKSVDYDDSDDDESEDNETSDEDFQIDEVNEVSDSDEDKSSSSSDVDDDDDDDDDEEEEERKKKKRLRKCYNVREENDKKSEIYEDVKSENSPSPSPVINDELDHVDHATIATSSIFEKKGSFDPMKGSTPKMNGNITDDDDVIVIGRAKDYNPKTKEDKAKDNESVNLGDFSKDLGVECVSSFQIKQDKNGGSNVQKFSENNEGVDDKGRINLSCNGDKKASMESKCLNQRAKITLFMPKDSIVWEEDKDDGVNRKPPIDRVETPSMIWSFKKVEKMKKSKEDEELDALWDQMNKSLREEEVESMIGNRGTKEARQGNKINPSSVCKHDIRLEDDIGVYCKLCGWVVTEIRDVSPLVEEKKSRKYYVEEVKDKKSGICEEVKSDNRHCASSVNDGEFEKDGGLDPMKNFSSSNSNGNITDDVNGIAEDNNLKGKTKAEEDSGICEVKSDNRCCTSSVNNGEFEKDGDLDPMESFSSSNPNKNITDDVNGIAKDNNPKAKTKAEEDSAKGIKSVNLGNYGKGLGVECVSSFQTKQDKVEGSDKQKILVNNGRGDNKGRTNIHSNDDKYSSVENKCVNQRGVKSTLVMPKELRLVELLAEFYLGNKSSIKKDSIVLEEEKVDNVNRRPPTNFVETLPLIWNLKKVEKLKKSQEDEELDELWDQMNRSLREEEVESMIGNLETNEATQENKGSPSSVCEHDLRLEDDIGVYCKLCGWVVTEIKDVSPPVVDRYPYEIKRKRTSVGGENVPFFDGSVFNVSDDDESKANLSHKEGTVWDLIPDVKQTLYPHQQEGFEFIWKNMAGSIDLHKLKNPDPRREGGCIISHAPGTGKTRLTIVFLMAYLKVFPKCLPVIVAPANLLLTWEDEFKKWDIGVPFHNLNSLDLSGKEYDDDVFKWSNTRHSKETMRMAKLCSWFKEKSILGVSYSLYTNLAGGGISDVKKNKKHSSVEDVMRNILLETPGLLVLDEGHTPRNQKSRVWKVLSEIQTKKRIILSGTPFQNNFLELYNTLSLVKPSFPNTIPHELKKFCQKQEHKKVSKEWSWEPVSSNTTSDGKIKQLKLLMDPFVHVHKGAILEKKLPGLRDCVLTLKPDRLQKQILKSIQSSQNTLLFEHKQTMASIHPSLFLECSDLLEEEESVVDKDRLEKLRWNPYGGVKTKFLVEFVKLCDAVNEKVLVFSQFINPLRLIKDQLNSVFNWTEGKEMVYMDGQVDLKEKQSLIHSFNDASSQAKILLASTKACSEGISLVGASRVVLLDVMWNPSVERQAISRAYRIGQKKVVYTYHLLTQGTTECIKYCKQAEKDRLSELIFSAKNADSDGSKCRAVKFEDKILDQMISHKKLKDMFVECVIQPKERDESFGY